MGISLLTVLLFVLVTPVIIDFTIFHDKQHNLYYGLVIGLLLGMSILDIYKNKFPIFEKLRSWTVFLIIGLTVGVGCVVYIYDRYKIAPTYRTHDIVIQQEVAVRMLLTGKNPYKETYFNTPLQDFKYSDSNINPALYHFVNEPLYLVSVIPFYFIESKFFGFFDARVPLYLLFLVLLFGGYRIIKDRENKLLFITLMTFNPMTMRFFLEGRSDMFMLPFLFFGFIFLHKKNFILASIFIAFAFAVKQSVWPLLPFFVYFLWLKTENYKLVFKYFLVFAFTLGIFILPFLLWDPKAFLNSTVFYLSGNTAHAYPISGYGFGILMKDLGFIKDVYASYPFMIWQIIIGVPILIFLVRYLKNNPSVKALIICYTIFLAVFWYFSRYLNDSHIGFISSLFIIAYFWPNEDINPKPKKTKRN